MRTRLICIWCFIALFAGAAALGEDCHCNTAKQEAALLSRLGRDKAKYGARSDNAARDSLELAKLYSRRGKIEQSEKYLVDARANSATASEAATQSARNSMVKQKSADAEKKARDGARLARHPLDKARALGVLGWALGEQSKYAEGVASYKEALELRKRCAKTAEEIEETAMQMQQLASLYQKAGQKENAIKTLNKAAFEMERAHGKGHPLAKLAHQMANAARK